MDAQSMGLRLVNPHKNEWNGPCPICGGVDRFYLWIHPDGRANWWCRKAEGHKPTGWQDELPGMPRHTRLDVLPVRRKQREVKVKLTLEQVERFASNMEAVWRSDQPDGFYPSRGLTQEAVRVFRLGFDPYPRFPSYTLPYIMSDMETVLKVNRRRDDDGLARALDMDDNLREAALARARQRHPELTDLTTIQLARLAFPKYRAVRGSSNASIFNAAILKLALPYVMITESELDAAALTTVGYPAIACKIATRKNGQLSAVYSRLAGMLRAGLARTSMVYIIADRDPAGAKYAANMQLALAHIPSTIISPPPPATDAGEALENGTLDAWLKRYVPLNNEPYGYLKEEIQKK